MRTQVGHWEYEIDDNLVISAWYLDNLNTDVEGCPPSIRQPHHPSGEAFKDYEDAKNWVESHVLAFDARVEEEKQKALEPVEELQELEPVEEPQE